jgi:hypothetical protein
VTAERGGGRARSVDRVVGPIRRVGDPAPQRAHLDLLSMPCHRDAASGILVPASADEWAGVMARAGIVGAGRPSVIFSSQEVSEVPMDSIGELGDVDDVAPTPDSGGPDRSGGQCIEEAAARIRRRRDELEGAELAAFDAMLDDLKLRGALAVRHQEGAAGWTRAGVEAKPGGSSSSFIVFARPSPASTGDSDLDSALLHNVVALSGSVDAILSTIVGENEGANWHWLVLLSSGRFAYITGGCDYTGWDCQSSCEAFEADSLREVLRLVPEAFHDDVLAGLSRTRDELEGDELAAFDALVGRIP